MGLFVWGFVGGFVCVFWGVELFFNSKFFVVLLCLLSCFVVVVVYLFVSCCCFVGSFGFVVGCRLLFVFVSI